MTEGGKDLGDGIFGRERLQTVAEVYVGEIAKVGRWVVANVETRDSWPTMLREATFAGEQIWIVPLTTDAYPALVMRLTDGRSREDCERILMRFLSSLAWVNEAGYMVDTFSGGSNARPMGRRRPNLWMTRTEFDLDYIPEPTDDRAQRALALMREGRAVARQSECEQRGDLDGVASVAAEG